MDGHSVSEAVQHVPEAVPAVEAAPAALPGLVSSAGNTAIATAAAGPAQAAAPGTPPEASRADLAIARELAGAVQRRAGEPAELSVARFTWPWETEAPRQARSGVGEAASQAAEKAAAAAKAEAEAKAQKDKTEAEIKTLYSANTIVSGQIMVTLASAQTALGSPSANVAMVKSQLTGLAPALNGLGLPDGMQEHVNGAIFDSIRVAVSTLGSVDEPRQTTINDTKEAFQTAIDRLNEAITEGETLVAGPPNSAGQATSTPKLDGPSAGALKGSLAQITGLKEALERTMTPQDTAQAAKFAETTADSIRNISYGAHEDVRPTIDLAYRATKNGALYLEALGRDKAANLKLAADAVGMARSECQFLLGNIEKGIKEKEAQANPPAPPATGAPASTPSATPSTPPPSGSTATPAAP